MIYGMGDVDESFGPDESCCSTPEKRRRKALKQLRRAARSGALAAGGQLGDLGALEAGAWFPTRNEVEEEAEAFDGRLNAWMVDFQGGTNRVPPAVIQQVDDFIFRWRDLRSSFFVFSQPRANAILALESEFNQLQDKIASFGVSSSVGAAMVTVDGQQVRADKVPPGSSTLDRVTSLVKWGGLLVGGVAAYKVASELGLVARVARLFGGGGGGGGGGAVRRYGSAKRSNPKRKRRRRR